MSAFVKDKWLLLAAGTYAVNILGWTAYFILRLTK